MPMLIPDELLTQEWWSEKRIWSKTEAALDVMQMASSGAVQVSCRSLASRWMWDYKKVERFLKKITELGWIEYTSTKLGSTIRRVSSDTPNDTPNDTPKARYTKGFQELDDTLNDTPSDTQSNKRKKSPITPKKENYKRVSITNAHTHTCEKPIDSFNFWLSENCPYLHTNLSLLSQKEYDKLVSSYNEEQIKETCLQIENRKDLRKRYKNLYLTLLNWLKKDYGIKPQLPLQERKRLFQESLRPFLEEFGRDTLNRFYAHWSQTETGDKENPRMKFEMEKFFELGNQLFLWRQRNLT
jgi:hypothetical protein